MFPATGRWVNPAGPRPGVGDQIPGVGCHPDRVTAAARVRTTAVVKFFYGAKVPAGTLYFPKPNGKKVDKRSTCTKTAAGYDTPCVFGKEVVGGTTGNKYAQDTVYFAGNDPAMGRR